MAKNKLSAFYARFVEIVKEVLNGGSTHTISRKIGISQSALQKKFVKYGIKTNPKNSPSNRKIKTKCLLCDNDTRYPNKYCDQCILSNKHIKSHQKLEDAKGIVAIKRLFIKEAGYKCAKCGITSWDNKHIVMELHHIDGNADNNSKENLMLLCPNCHSQTETYKSKNKIASSSRRKVYRKSYRG